MNVAGEHLRISVIIPTYNSVQRLTATIRSVLDQSCPAAEIIVIDDGSTDATSDVATVFGDRIRYFRIENGGQQRARNYGAAQATGDWIALLDHDDLWEPDYLAEVQAIVCAHQVDITLCNSRTWQEDPAGGFWRDEHRFTQFAPPGYWDRVGADPSARWAVLDRYPYGGYLEFHPSQTSMMTIRRDLYEALGGFDERMRGSSAENFEFEIRALRAGRVGLIWRPLVTMVRHDANASLDSCRMAMDLVACLQFALAAHGLDEDERATATAELQKRLPSAIYGSFSLGEYDAVRAFRRAYRGRLSWKARLKCAIARLPRPWARSIASLLGA